MPNVKISELPVATVLDGGEVMPVVQDGITKQIATSAMGLLPASGILPIAQGGTGQTTANAAANALLPAQTAQSGKYLSTDGVNSSWQTAGGSIANVVQRFALIAEASSTDPSGSLSLINSSATINDGDSLFVNFTGGVEDASATPTVQVDFRVNGSTVMQQFYTVSDAVVFSAQLQITRVGLNLAAVGLSEMGIPTSGTGNPSRQPHIAVAAATPVYGGALTVTVEFTLTTSSEPFFAVNGGFAQIMRAT